MTTQPTTMTPYLYFKGDCEAALTFYAACGLGSVKELRRFENAPGTDAGWKDKVLHSIFEGPGLRLAASDTNDAEPMKGCALMLELTDADAAAALFAALSAGGRVTVPFAKQFWGDHYGNFTDRYGVQWGMNATEA